MEYIEKTLTGIITHGTNSITFTDDFITNESIIDVYFSDDDIIPTEQTQDGNRLIISIESQPQDVSIAVHITNDDTINYADELDSLSETVDEHATAISDLAIEIDNLNASNISYDEHSTLYSAMGDIDELETTSKNLVGAINEVKESGGGGSAIPYESGTLTKNDTYVNSTTSYYIKLGRLVCVWVNDIIFKNATHFDGGLFDKYVLRGLPKKSNKNAYFLLRGSDNTNVVRLRVINGDSEARLCPHYTTLFTTITAYGVLVYESEE